MNYQQPKYDTIEGIKDYIKDLAGLNKLKSDRSKAYYDRKESLHEFYLFGRWSLDQCGNFMKICGDQSYYTVPALAIPRCPSVLTREEMFALLSADSSISSSMGSDLPPDYVKCSVCETPWTISNCHDCISSNTTEVIDTEPFVGAYLNKINELPQYMDISPHHVGKEYIRPKN